MQDLVLWGGVFILSLIILIRAANYFTDASVKLGQILGMPSFIVGVTIIAIGTSLPELITSVIAVIRGNSEIVSATVVGSNIANIFFTLGLFIVLSKSLKILHKTIRIDLPFFVTAAFLVALIMWDGLVDLPDAVVLLVSLTLFLFHTATANGKKQLYALAVDQKAKKKWQLNGKLIFILLASALLIYLGANYILEAVLQISSLLSIGSEKIAASAIALGTSLPELTVSLAALKKGQAEAAVGNILGSNIFNALGVTGIAALFGPLVVPTSIITFALPVMLIATLLYFFMGQDKELTVWEGGMLIVFYLFFQIKFLNLF